MNMSRPIKYDDEALLESLRATFLELGPAATSTELARRAGVSEGTLFKRFGTKRHFFERAMRLPAIQEEPWFRDMLQQAGRGSLHGNIAGLAKSVMSHFAEVLPILETLMTSVFKARDMTGVLDEDVDSAPPRAIQRQVTKYLEREMSLGRIRKVDSHTLTDLIVGSCFKHMHEQAHFPGLFGSETTEQVADRIADLIVGLTALPVRAQDARQSSATARKAR